MCFSGRWIIWQLIRTINQLALAVNKNNRTFNERIFVWIFLSMKLHQKYASNDNSFMWITPSISDTLKNLKFFSQHLLKLRFLLSGIGCVDHKYLRFSWDKVEVAMPKVDDIYNLNVSPLANLCDTLSILQKNKEENYVEMVLTINLLVIKEHIRYSLNQSSGYTALAICALACESRNCGGTVKARRALCLNRCLISRGNVDNSVI